MMLRTGRQQQQNSRSGVTLLELILVMAILATVMAVAVPQLKGFSAGRRYDAEWNRFVAALRYARNEAISRSVPVEIRLDTERNAYRFAGGYGFDHLPDGTTERTLPEELEFEISEATETSEATTPTTGARPMTPATESDPTPVVGDTPDESASIGEPSILFWPDGTVDDASPAEIWITERNGVFAKVVRKNSVLGYAVSEEGLDDVLPQPN